MSHDEGDGRAADGPGTTPGGEADAALDEFMRRVSWDAWRAPAPPADFAQRVVQRVHPGAAQHSPRRGWRSGISLAAARALGAPRVMAPLVVVLLLGALLVGSALSDGRLGPPRGEPSGERFAAERLELSIGRRALAVLEAGARLRWRDDRVSQSDGDVFYRVEPGETFVVSTPNGTLEVLGTCFRVSVERAADAATRVSVYEGRVRLRAAGGLLELGAGESARLEPDGVRRSASAEGEPRSTSADARAQAPSPPRGLDDAGATSRDELDREVAWLRAELARLKQQQAALDERVAAARARLLRAGGEAPARHRYDLTADDWKELAKTGTVKFRLPCERQGFRMRPALLDRLGLMPDDASVIERAYADSRDRVWRVLGPLCVTALGRDDLAELLGREGCTTAVLQAERRRDKAGSDAAMRQVGEIRAGLRPLPAPGEPLHPVLEMFLALTGEPARFEAELAERLGPEDAKRIAFSDEMCHERLTLDGPTPDGPSEPEE